MVCRMCAFKNFGNIKKSDFGIFIEHKNNLKYEGGRLAQCDTRDQCSYEDGGAFNDATVYNKVCVFEGIFVYDNALMYWLSREEPRICMFTKGGTLLSFEYE